jgi:UbiD family decarboxylase
MRFDSLRGFIDAADAGGDVARMAGVSADLEIGVLTELSAEQSGPLLYFDQFEGLPPSYGVATNVLNTPRRFALAHGLDASMHPIDLLRSWRQKLGGLSVIPPREVTDGRVLENVVTGDIDLAAFPRPTWHEGDGGAYVGTGDIVVVRDVTGEWVNLGVYRGCVQGPDLLSLWIIKNKHGRMVAEGHWARGESCPVAVVLGADPITWSAAASGQPHGVSEYGHAGALHGGPVDIITTPKWGLPVPAGAELVLEGVILDPAVTSVAEGPFGEWPGYYSHTGQECVVQVQTVLHANDPVIYGAPPLRPVGGTFGIPTFAAGLWDHLERSGVTDVQGVWGFCNSLMIVVSLKQRYAGHAKQALLAAAGLRTSASMYRYYVVVDDDIDPSNLDEVVWAMCTRTDPAENVDVIRGAWTSGVDPRVSPADLQSGNLTAGRLLIDACKPFHWKDDFPRTNIFGPDRRQEVGRKWRHVLKEFGVSVG